MLVNSELTNHYKIIIKKEELITTNPSKDYKFDPVSNLWKNSIGEAWLDKREFRSLDYQEILNLIQKKLEDLDKKKKQKIGKHASIDMNADIFALRI
jgi:hypothetical protein